MSAPASKLSSKFFTEGKSPILMTVHADVAAGSYFKIAKLAVF